MSFNAMRENKVLAKISGFTVFLILITESQVLPMCASESGTSTGNLLYLKNIAYPASIGATETSCTCSVETTSCTSNINVYFVHLTLNATQKIKINDNGAENTYASSDNTDFAITQMLTSSGNYITVSLENTDGMNAGYLFIGYEGMLNAWRKLLNDT